MCTQTFHTILTDMLYCTFARLGCRVLHQHDAGHEFVVSSSRRSTSSASGKRLSGFTSQRFGTQFSSTRLKTFLSSSAGIASAHCRPPHPHLAPDMTCPYLHPGALETESLALPRVKSHIKYSRHRSTPTRRAFLRFLVALRQYRWPSTWTYGNARI